MGDRIRARRHAQGLTLKAIARRSGIAIGTISQIERAASAPSVSSLFAIARALGAKVTDLLPEMA